MKSKYSSLLLSAALLVNCHSFDKNNVDAVIAEHIKALGGLEQLQSLQSLKMTGYLNQAGLRSELIVYRQRPNLYRMEYRLAGNKVITTFDGETAWRLSERRSPEPTKITDVETLALIEATADFDNILVNYREKGHRVELVGKETVDGRTAYKIDVTTAAGKEFSCYLDTSTFLLVKRIAMMNYDWWEIPLAHTIIYKDHAKEGGLVMPHYIETEQLNSVREEEIEAVQLNVELDEAMFTLGDGDQV